MRATLATSQNWKKKPCPQVGFTSGEPTHTGTSPTITWMFPGDRPLTCRQDKALSQARDKAQVGTYLKSESGNDPCLRTQTRQLISVGDESLAKQPQERHHGQRKRPKRPNIPLWRSVQWPCRKGRDSQGKKMETRKQFRCMHQIHKLRLPLLSSWTPRSRKKNWSEVHKWRTTKKNPKNSKF